MGIDPTAAELSLGRDHAGICLMFEVFKQMMPQDIQELERFSAGTGGTSTQVFHEKRSALVGKMTGQGCSFRCTLFRTHSTRDGVIEKE
jgi:hypothetical protein